jgi:hypothetical protein
MHVANDANDLILFRIAWILINAKLSDAFTERIVVGKIAFDERLVDDGCANIPALVLLIEVASSQQRKRTFAEGSFPGSGVACPSILKSPPISAPLKGIGATNAALSTPGKALSCSIV